MLGDGSFTKIGAALQAALSLITLGACKRDAGDVVSAREFRLTDGERTRATLGLAGGPPALTLLDRGGKTRLRVALDGDDRPSVALFDPARAEPAAIVELDDKGAHVLFRGPGKQESYVFQKADGTAGLVLVGPNGVHRGQLLLSPNGDVNWSLRDGDGHAKRSVTVGGNGVITTDEATR